VPKPLRNTILGNGRENVPRLIRAWAKAVAGLAALAFVALFSAPCHADNIPIIDAHSQLSDPQTANHVIDWMNAAGVAHTILSFRSEGGASDVIGLARKNPGRITPAIKIKGPAWQKGGSAFAAQVERQLSTGGFGALGEALVYHAAKGNRAPEWSVSPGDPQFQSLLSVARRFRWPVITHIEAHAAPSQNYIAQLEAVLSQNRDVAFPLIHMGQLDPASVQRLISAHPNVYFMTSHANSITTARSRQPWTNMFSGGELRPDWRRLMVAHPERFILAFDNVWPGDWGNSYVQQVQLWRNALAGLPSTAAHKIAHQNAERLWRLRPAVAGAPR
jgi:predicted TIM-barrel fold metal-dependent hydrolase